MLNEVHSTKVCPRCGDLRGQTGYDDDGAESRGRHRYVNPRSEMRMYADLDLGAVFVKIVGPSCGGRTVEVGTRIASVLSDET